MSQIGSQTEKENENKLPTKCPFQFNHAVWFCGKVIAPNPKPNVDMTKKEKLS